MTRVPLSRSKAPRSVARPCIALCRSAAGRCVFYSKCFKQLASLNFTRRTPRRPGEKRDAFKRSICLSCLNKQSSPRDSQFTGERKLACRDGADLVRRRVLLARERAGPSVFDLSVSTRPGASEEAGRREKTKTENNRGGRGPGMKNQKNTP